MRRLNSRFESNLDQSSVLTRKCVNVISDLDTDVCSEIVSVLQVSHQSDTKREISCLSPATLFCLGSPCVDPYRKNTEPTHYPLVPMRGHAHHSNKRIHSLATFSSLLTGHHTLLISHALLVCTCSSTPSPHYFLSIPFYMHLLLHTPIFLDNTQSTNGTRCLLLSFFCLPRFCEVRPYQQ